MGALMLLEQEQNNTLDSRVGRKRGVSPKISAGSEMSQGDAVWERSLQTSHDLLEKMYDDALEQY